MSGGEEAPQSDGGQRPSPAARSPLFVAFKAAVAGVPSPRKLLAHALGGMSRHGKPAHSPRSQPSDTDTKPEAGASG